MTLPNRRAVDVPVLLYTRRKIKEEGGGDEKGMRCEEKGRKSEERVEKARKGQIKL